MYYPGGAANFHAYNADVVPGHARSCYAVNGGDQGPVVFTGPSSVQDGENPNWSGWPGWRFSQTGVSYLRSKVTMGEVSDGASNTYFAGEKYINTDDYLTGKDGADNTSMYKGHDWDVMRWANQANPPRQDRQGYSNWNIFGGPHSGGFMSVLCDGSVRMFSYSIEPRIHGYLGSRRDRQPIDASEL